MVFENTFNYRPLKKEKRTAAVFQTALFMTSPFLQPYNQYLEAT